MAAVAIAAGLLLILLAVDNGANPGIEAGFTLLGTWALLYGYYFKSKRLQRSGMVLMALAVVSLYVYIGSVPSERYDSTESSALIDQELKRSTKN
ncbi:MAG: hypothetical protein ACJAY7_001611 [Pseudohongiellaceae bacterium]|jgi:hypothetical protein